MRRSAHRQGTIDASTPVLVLGSARYGALAIARTLGRLGVPVYVLDANPPSPASFSKYCCGTFDWSCGPPRTDDCVERLVGIGRTLGRRAILIPTSDAAALFLAANAHTLEGRFLFPALPLQRVQSLHSKREMYFLARNVDVPTPDTFFPASRREVLDFAAAAEFPVMMKPVEQRLAAQGRASAVIARGKQDLLDYYEIMEDPHHPNVMLQEYIPGGDDATWMFNGYFDQRSECLFGLTGKKIRQHHPYAGITSLGVCQPNAVVAQTTVRFMQAIGYQGILDIGYRYDARDGTYKVFDVNPRIGCTFRLFVADNGMDVARALYLDLTGQPVAAGEAFPGRKWIVEDIDLASSFRYWRDGNLTVGGWLRSFRGLQESAFFARDDPRPFLEMCVQNLRRLYPSQNGGLSRLWQPGASATGGPGQRIREPSPASRQ